MQSNQTYRLFLMMLFCISCKSLYAQDSSHLLKRVTLLSVREKNSLTKILPAQKLDAAILQKINAPTVGDAARFFSGVQVKDYGGTGGLKTISVRSLGASHTSILYDGIPVTDAQSGQVDLSRFSITFLQDINLYQAFAPGSLQPARIFSAASVLAINTLSYYPALPNKKLQWQAGLQAGSFNYKKAFAGAQFVLPKNFSIGINADLLSSKGDYPFTVDNGNLSEKSKRNNSVINSVQGEINALKLFNDSSTLQVKAWAYDSKRGLPNAVIFFNDRSKQQLWNRDYFFQSRYKRELNASTLLQLSAKYNHNYTRYRDPDFLNNAGGLDDQYNQTESYFSGAISHRFTKNFSADLASDLAYTKLEANKQKFAFPSRLSTWNNFLIRYDDSLWQANASVLWSHFSDEVKQGTATGTKNKITPTIAISRKLNISSPFMLRAFYKEVFRMPTFNDLYYNFIGNTNLRPEYARQYNLGLSYSKTLNKKINQFSFSADGYINKIKDKIIAVPGQNLFSWRILNLGEVNIKGIDITAEANGNFNQSLQWFVRLTYTWQNAIDATDPASTKYKNRIPYTPDHSGSAIASLTYKKWDAGYSLTFSGTRYTLGDNNPFNELNGWAVHDLFISRKIKTKLFGTTIKTELNNLTDTRYDVIKYYPMPGRSYKISLLFNHS